MASPLTEPLVPLCDLDCRVPGPGRLRAVGESSPFRSSSATTALSEEESGDIRGPGVKRAIDRLDRADGRWLLDESLSPR